MTDFIQFKITYLGYEQVINAMYLYMKKLHGKSINYCITQNRCKI